MDLNNIQLFVEVVKRNSFAEVCIVDSSLPEAAFQYSYLESHTASTLL
jgi:hypothetical protein